jgi:hypothetical protein
MEKNITCTKCRRTFTVSGHHTGVKEVPQGVTCPYCNEPSEVLWPMDAGFVKTKLGHLPSQGGRGNGATSVGTT